MVLVMYRVDQIVRLFCLLLATLVSAVVLVLLVLIFYLVGIALLFELAVYKKQACLKQESLELELAEV